jgi:hypothetical protein
VRYLRADDVKKGAGGPLASDAHESCILAEALGLASIFLPRNRLATLERASTVLDYTRPFTPLVLRCATVLDATRRHSPALASAPPSSTTLDSTRPRLAHSCASRPLAHHLHGEEWVLKRSHTENIDGHVAHGPNHVVRISRKSSNIMLKRHTSLCRIPYVRCRMRSTWLGYPGPCTRSK